MTVHSSQQQDWGKSLSKLLAWVWSGRFWSAFPVLFPWSVVWDFKEGQLCSSSKRWAKQVIWLHFRQVWVFDGPIFVLQPGAEHLLLTLLFGRDRQELEFEWFSHTMFGFSFSFHCTVFLQSGQMRARRFLPPELGQLCSVYLKWAKQNVFLQQSHWKGRKSWVLQSCWAQLDPKSEK